MIKKNVLILNIVFYIILFIPSCVMGLFHQSSYATGIIVLSIFLILIRIFLSLNKDNQPAIKPSNNGNLKLVSVLFLLLFAQSLIAFQITTLFDFSRFVSSIILLMLMIYSAQNFIKILDSFSNMEIKRSLFHISYTLLFIFIIFGILNLNPLSYTSYSRPIFPFLEPSHFALIIAPYYLWIISTRDKKYGRFLVILIGLIGLFFINNVTLLILISIATYIAFGTPFLLFLIPFIAIISMTNILSYIEIDYFIDRLSFLNASNTNSNLSSLVWIQGWQEAVINIKKTYGMGVGFQQFGIVPPTGEASKTIFYLFQNYLNRYDGGTFGAKFIGEFGIIGLMFILVFLKKIYQSIYFLRISINKSNKLPLVLFFNCCIAFFGLDIFVRGIGYFSPSVFMFLVGVFGLSYSNNQNDRIERKDNCSFSN